MAGADLKPVVFLGPSLSRALAASIVDADFRPPVKRGDLADIPSEVRYVVIVDGEFKQNLSASPKEILTLIDRGVCVLGASSMGALRAAELAPFGMRGVGWVYEAYSSGRITGDDEVALTYSPMDFSALTVPLVNIRFWLDELHRAGQINKRDTRIVLRTLRDIYFVDRSHARVWREVEQLFGVGEMTELLTPSGGALPDIKARDAEGVLTLLRKIRQSRMEDSYGEHTEGSMSRHAVYSADIPLAPNPARS